jgi:cobaltochelatase CobN
MPTGIDPSGRCALTATRGNRHRQAARHLAVGLRFGGARADRAPRDQVGKILRRDRIERLGRAGQAHRVQIEEQAARNAQALLDVKAVVQIRIVYQPLPADRGARLLEIHAHDHEQRIGELGGKPSQPPAVVMRRRRIVDRARPDDDEQPRIAPLEDRLDRVAPVEHRTPRGVAQRQCVAQGLGRDERRLCGDV